MTHHEAAVIPDIYADARVPHDAYRPTFVKSMCMVPIRAADPVGAIGNYWAVPHQIREGEVILLRALADSTAVALQNVSMLREPEEARLETLQRLAVSEIDRLAGQQFDPRIVEALHAVDPKKLVR